MCILKHIAYTWQSHLLRSMLVVAFLHHVWAKFLVHPKCVSFPKVRLSQRISGESTWDCEENTIPEKLRKYLPEIFLFCWFLSRVLEIANAKPNTLGGNTISTLLVCRFCRPHVAECFGLFIFYTKWWEYSIVRRRRSIGHQWRMRLFIPRDLSSLLPLREYEKWRDEVKERRLFILP